jgi:hypothetical protein
LSNRVMRERPGEPLANSSLWAKLQENIASHPSRFLAGRGAIYLML